MECPACHNNSQPGPKFCGACGHELQRKCPSCGTTRPAAENFCGRCGKRLATGGTIALARSGLIADIDQNAASLLGYAKEELTGKPFSLFVAREDLPVFFSHWNELISSGDRQSAELAVRQKTGKKIYVAIEWMLGESASTPGHFHLILNPAGSHRAALDRLQYQQDLLNLIYSLADSVRTVSERRQASAVVQGLKRICLFLKADLCFIYAIDRRRKRLQIRHQWHHAAGSNEKPLAGTIPLAAIKRSIARLRQERVYLIEDVSRLPKEERNGLLAAFHQHPATLMCQLIYTHKRPLAVIGAARRNLAAGVWSADDAALIKLFGQLVYDLPSLARVAPRPVSTEPVSNDRRAGHTPSSVKKYSDTAQSTAGRPVHSKEMRQEAPGTSKQSPPKADVKPLPNIGVPMQLERMTGIQSIARQRVFVREDGLVSLTCPHCGLQESVTTARFEMLGNAVTVRCACRKQFAAVLEKRRSVRKTVQLEGYFTIAGEFGPEDTRANIWGPIIVKNLSKSGLRFHSPRADLIAPGDLLVVRFNLNNSNKALIHKKAQVVSIQGNEVGCRFEGADEYDITLGFYFM
jgi:PAS domain S-box-containing protein